MGSSPARGTIVELLSRFNEGSCSIRIFIRMWKCKHCNQEFEFSTTSQKSNHCRWCVKNPKFETYKKNQYTDGTTMSEKTRQKIRVAAIGRHHSEETKKKLSDMGLKSKHRRLVRNILKYTSKDGSVIYMDSSWEIELAKRLDFLNIRWNRPNPIPWVDKMGKTHNYFPDFHLLDYDLYLDPKNPAAYLNQKEKIECVMKAYSNVRILRTLDECKNFVSMS